MKEGNKVRCDVCEKIIQEKNFRVVLIHIADYKSCYEQGALANCERELDVCNSCIDHLNFRKYKPRRPRSR